MNTTTNNLKILDDSESPTPSSSECNFEDSLDRILSSASASSAEDNNNNNNSPNYNSDNPPHIPIPKFPVSGSKFDVWIHGPLSVHQRRKRLLQEMGLSHDPLLSRTDEGSASDDHLCRKGGHEEEQERGSSTHSISVHNVSFVDSSSNNNNSVDEIEKTPTRRILKKMENITPLSSTNLNLDNGQKVKEIDTSHQFTLEEFESGIGHSPIVQELMRRHNVEKLEESEGNENGGGGGVGGNGGIKAKKKVSWFKSIKNVASAVTGHWERRNSEEWDTSSEKAGRRSSSGTEDSQSNSLSNHPEKVRVRQNGKSLKELTALYKNQEIQAHNGPIWSIKFSLDGQYLASAGEDCVIHVWQVTEMEKKGDSVIENGNSNPFVIPNGSAEVTLVPTITDNHLEKKKRSKVSISRKSGNLEHVVVPDGVFALSEKPVCSFRGHLVDVLDLSWSKSRYLLSSSMDKTVKLWHIGSSSCLKTFSHSDYVTCIHFNPIDDRYFISGSIDAKVRIWSIPERQVVDWSDLHEMVTAASYTPDGQGALVGSYKGSCRLFTTSENKLQQKSLIDLQNKKKKSHLKKITGFQFSPGSSSEVLITSADSRIRVVDGMNLVHKFKGFRNTNSQMSASLTANGKYVVCASEDSHVCVWKHETSSRPSRNKGVTITHSYEHFRCQDISVAVPWPVVGAFHGIQDCTRQENRLPYEISAVNRSSPAVEEINQQGSLPSLFGGTKNTLHDTVSSVNNTYFFDRFSVTWPEENLPVACKNQLTHGSGELSNGTSHDRSALGMVIVTATLKGEIKIYQNFGLPVRV